MLRPALQLRIGKQLTMTPQLQQAIRLLQLPALELQQTVREALEQNVMLEADDDGEGESPLEAADAVIDPSAEPGQAEETAHGEAAADAAEEAWDEGPSAATSDSPWSGDDRPQEFTDERGQTGDREVADQTEHWAARFG